MKGKVFHFVVGLCLCLFSLTLVFSGSTFAYSEKAPLVLKASSGTPPGTINSKTLTRFCKLVEERTNGRVKFKMFYSGSLVIHPKFFDGVTKGISDISTGPVSFITNKVPDLSIFEIYGSHRNENHLQMLEATEPVFNKILEREGAYSAFHDFTGPAVFAHKTKFMKSPDDWEGQKMRIAGRWGASLGKTWGASPIFMGTAEMYLALQRGVIDGYMLIWSFLYVMKLYEVAPYMTDTGFSSNYSICPMNLKKWNALTETDKEIFRQVAKEINVYSDKAVREENERVKKDIIAKGGKIYDLTSEERSRYLEDCYALWPEVRKISGPLGNELTDILENFRAR